MNVLTAFGLIAVTLMLVFYTLESRSRWYTLAFGGAVHWVRRMGFSKELGHSDWSKPYGLLSQSGVGG